MAEQGQLELTVNWVYILIAGTVILLFFTGIVVKQKDISEEQLSADVIKTMESLFTAAGVSEKTKNIISVSGLGDYVLEFGCQNGVSTFGIAGQQAKIQNARDPIFSTIWTRRSVRTGSRAANRAGLPIHSTAKETAWKRGDAYSPIVS